MTNIPIENTEGKTTEERLARLEAMANGLLQRYEDCHRLLMALSVAAGRASGKSDECMAFCRQVAKVLDVSPALEDYVPIRHSRLDAIENEIAALRREVKTDG